MWRQQRQIDKFARPTAMAPQFSVLEPLARDVACLQNAVVSSNAVVNRKPVRHAIATDCRIMAITLIDVAQTGFRPRPSTSFGPTDIPIVCAAVSWSVIEALDARMTASNSLLVRRAA
jgi:hypothetical protein